MRRIALMAGTLAAIVCSAVAFAAPDPAPTTPAAPPDPLQGAWVMLLDGAVAGHVASIDRCGVAAEVAETRDAKQVAGYAPDVCDIEVGLGMSRQFVAWLNSSLAGGPEAHTVQLVRFDVKPAVALELTGATVRSFTIPRIVRGDRTPGFLKLSLQAEGLRHVPAAPLPLIARMGPILGAFDVQVDGMPADVSAIGPWTATVQPRERGADFRVPGGSRSTLDHLPLRVGEAGAASTFGPWLSAFMEGKNGGEYERTTTLTLGVFRFDFKHTGPASGDLAPRADGNRNYELYTERVSVAMR